eukprot:17995-Eustigmatos_ZCMA.PRE.1
MPQGNRLPVGTLSVLCYGATDNTRELEAEVKFREQLQGAVVVLVRGLKTVLQRRDMPLTELYELGWKAGGVVYNQVYKEDIRAERRPKARVYKPVCLALCMCRVVSEVVRG